MLVPAVFVLHCTRWKFLSLSFIAIWIKDVRASRIIFAYSVRHLLRCHTVRPSYVTLFRLLGPLDTTASYHLRFVGQALLLVGTNTFALSIMSG